jgi:hypothetical protein
MSHFLNWAVVEYRCRFPAPPNDYLAWRTGNDEKKGAEVMQTIEASVRWNKGDDHDDKQ